MMAQGRGRMWWLEQKLTLGGPYEHALYSIFGRGARCGLSGIPESLQSARYLRSPAIPRRKIRPSSDVARIRLETRPPGV